MMAHFRVVYFLARHLTERALRRIPIDVIMTEPLEMSKSDSMSHPNPLELRHELWELTNLRGSATITHHMSERRHTDRINGGFRSEVRRNFNADPHLSAQIKSPNKSTMIKGLLSSSLSAHKVEQ